jgi:hypothetical protein
MAVHPDRYPSVILRGREAGLSALRLGDEQTRSAFFAERCSLGDEGNNDDDDDGTGGAGRRGDGGGRQHPHGLLLSSPLPAHLTVATTTTTTEEEDEADGGDDHEDDGNDDEDDGDEDDGVAVGHDGSEAGAPAPRSDGVPGHVFATGAQLLFVAADPADIGHDVAIGSACIVLHAMTDEPDLALYLQLSENGDGGNSYTSGPTEVTITPLDGDDCQLLFKTLCKMVSLHPAMDDDDEDDGDDGGDGRGELGFFGMGAGGYDDDDDGDDQLIWAPSGGRPAFGGGDDDDGDDDGATDEERAAMLERLDRLLVVRPGFEVQDGQFDDPEMDVVDVDGEGDEDDGLGG